jgi:hypothetical protein
MRSHVLLAVMICVGCGAPAAEVPGPNPYLPLADKHRWTYGFHNPKTAELLMWRWLDVDGTSPDGAWRLYWGRSDNDVGNPGRKPDALVTTTANTIIVAHGRLYAAVCPILPADFKSGSVLMPCDSESGSHTCGGWISKLEGHEEVTTPAGTFRTKRVTYTHTITGEGTTGFRRFTTWYASGTGVVRFTDESEYVMGDGNKATESGQAWVLIPNRD